MGRLRTFGVVAVLATLATAAAAADMPGASPPPPLQWHPPALFHLDTGWYLRGDLGYSIGTIGSADAAAGFTNPTGNKLGSGLSGGGGVGIKSNWLRTDFTIDSMAPLKYNGSIAAPNDVTAKISAISALFNGYLDLGTWYHVTPYIGAGVGTAYMHVTDYSSALAPPFSGGSHGQWNFAWAGMLGAAYAVAPNTMIDVGYRYINYGDVATASDSFGAMNFKNIAAHEVHVGVRWSFDDLAQR
jgi:opacity protein-like surface antigen